MHVAVLDETLRGAKATYYAAIIEENFFGWIIWNFKPVPVIGGILNIQPYDF